MSNRIVFESDTPGGVLALAATAMAPHVLRGQALQPVARSGSGGAETGNVGTTGTGNVGVAPLVTSERPAPVADTAEQQRATATAIAEVTDKPRRGRRARTAEAVAETTQPAPEPEKATVTVLAIDGPRQYETVGEALEGMADLLDLCESVGDVIAFIENHETLIAGAGEPGEMLRKLATERIDEIQTVRTATNTAAEDPIPAGDQVGAKPKAGTAVADTPPEMSLDDLEPPKFLKRTVEVTIDDVRSAFLAFCSLTEATQGRKLLDEFVGPTGRISNLKPEQLGSFHGQCRKRANVDDVAWGAALIKAAAVASAAGKTAKK